MLGVLFVIVLVPETQGKTPETMYELFQEPWCCGQETHQYQAINSHDSDGDAQDSYHGDTSGILNSRSYGNGTVGVSANDGF